mgnify:CR=1 FL=1
MHFHSKLQNQLHFNDKPQPLDESCYFKILRFRRSPCDFVTLSPTSPLDNPRDELLNTLKLETDIKTNIRHGIFLYYVSQSRENRGFHPWITETRNFSEVEKL